MTMDDKYIDVGSLSELHIPHIYATSWWCEAGDKKSRLNFSQDKSIRAIGVRFCLEDLRAKTLYAHVKLNTELSQNLQEPNDKQVDVYFERNAQDFLSAILIGSQYSDMEDALSRSFLILNSILSMLTFFYRRPFRVWQIHLTDEKHGIKLSTKSYCPKTAVFSLPSAGIPSHYPMGSLFSLYREGMNSLDIPYRYITFFKIYEAWYDKKIRKKFFNRKNRTQPKVLITKDMLMGFFIEKYHKPYLNKAINEKKIYGKLSDLRNMIAHPFLNNREPSGFIVLDSFESIKKLEAMANLIERIATEILEQELSIWAEERPDYKQLLAVYKRGG